MRPLSGALKFSMLALLAAAAALLGSCGGGSAGGGASVAPVEVTPVQAWISTADRSKLLARDPDLAFGAGVAGANNLDVDASVRYQQMVGFGAALTDSSAWLMRNRMSSAQRAALIDELFGHSGIGLSFLRLSLGASDFSRSHYTLDDMAPGQTDDALAHFSIDPMRADVLPTLKQALAANAQLSVMASPWSAPAWMKSNGSLIRSTDPNVQGTLLPQYYGAFARYLVKFADAMQAEGVPLYALSAQNEPHYEPADYPGMRLDPAQRAALVGQHLGPLLAQRAAPLRLLDWDHNWDDPASPLVVLADPVARPYVAGVAWHCYAGDVAAQSRVHDAYPDKEVFFTECSGGEWAPVWGDNLLWNVRTLVIGATRGWARGVLLWNLALDENHGPHLGGCGNCRGVVTVDSASGAVTRNVEYSALAHASRFVRPGASRIDSSTGVNGLDSVAFRNADDGSIALIVANSAAAARSFTVRQSGQTFAATLPAGSVATYSWLPKGLARLQSLAARMRQARHSSSGQSQGLSVGRRVSVAKSSASIRSRMRSPPWTTSRSSQPARPGTRCTRAAPLSISERARAHWCAISAVVLLVWRRASRSSRLTP